MLSNYHQGISHFSDFELESGAILPQIKVAYSTYGQLNVNRDNVIWVCHALTGNADVHEWWPGLIGPGKALDTDRFFIVCANTIGSCYGSTTPAELGWEFPLLTIRDMVQAYRLLQAELGIRKIRFGIGGSMGGQQILEWAIWEPKLFDKVCVLATNARHSPWGIAFNEAQRMALRTGEDLEEGLKTARAIAMLSYRTYQIFDNTQSDPANQKLDDFRASSYQRYQGQKLQQRFNPYSYWYLSKAMDSHNVGRGRQGIEMALSKIQAKTLIIGIRSDLLFPIEEQRSLAGFIPDARLEVIDSPFGHDGFLVEENTVARLVSQFLTPKETLSSSPLRFRRNHTALPGTESF